MTIISSCLVCTLLYVLRASVFFLDVIPSRCVYPLDWRSIPAAFSNCTPTPLFLCLLSTAISHKIAFLGIYLEKSSLYDQVIKKLYNIPEIVKVHYTTGNYNIFIKLHCRDTNHLKDVLHDKIQVVEGIERTETIISLEESLNRHIQFSV